MSNIYGKNKTTGQRNEAAAVSFLLSKGFGVKRGTKNEDYNHKVDVFARNKQGITYAIQVKPETFEMSEEDKQALISYSRMRGFEPRLIVVRDKFRCNFQKIEKEA